MASSDPRPPAQPGPGKSLVLVLSGAFDLLVAITLVVVGLAIDNLMVVLVGAAFGLAGISVLLLHRARLRFRTGD